jgi:hypothetical protein
VAGIFAIPAERPFLPDLAAGLLARAGGDPLALSRMLVLLPTRRAARGLARERRTRLGGSRARWPPSWMRSRSKAAISTRSMRWRPSIWRITGRSRRSC